MPYTGRPRGSGGPVPLIILGILFAAVGGYLLNQPFASGIALPFIGIGVVMLLGGIAWAGYRISRTGTVRSGPWAGAWTAPRTGGSTTVRTTTVDLRGQSAAPGMGFVGSGRAIVLNTVDRGPGAPGQQFMDLELLVQPPGSAPYPLTSRLLVPDAYRPRASIGTSLPVRLDPADPNRIIVEWNQP